MITLGYLLGVALATIIAGSVIYIAFLGFKSVISKLRDKEESIKPEEVGFILKEKMSSGDIKVHSGFFNRKTEKVTNTETYQAKEIDKEFQSKEDILIFD